MDDKSKRPLRSASNKIKDIYNAYVKNEEGNIMPANSSDNDKKYKDLNDSDDNPDSTVENAIIDKDELNQLYNKLDEITKERDELKDRLLRTSAEFENFRRRTLKEKQELTEYANERLLFKFLAFLDDCSTAIDAGKKSSDYQALLDGLELIYQKTQKLFEEAGVKQIESSVGKPLDVELHEAIAHIPSEVPEGHVIHEVQSGYMLRDKVLRHSKVVTSAGTPEE
jgi:molecular chaperone GrpE